MQARSQGWCGGGVRPLLATEWAKKGVRFKKSTFWVQKVHFWGIPHLPKVDPGYRPDEMH